MTEQLEIQTLRSEENERKPSLKLIKLIKCSKLLFYVLCLCVLSYQLVTLVMDYLQFETVVNVKYETTKFDALPGITICYPM